jgi:arsenate reductase
MKVLFLCATNSLHSAMAEALLSRIDSKHFEALSAGVSRGRLHPYTVEVMKEVGIDLSQRAPQNAEDLKDDNFDLAITLDEISRRVFPNFHRAETVHWKLDDLVAVSKDPERQLRAFRMVRDQIAQRLRLFVTVHARPLRRSLPAA